MFRVFYDPHTILRFLYALPSLADVWPFFEKGIVGIANIPKLIIDHIITQKRICRLRLLSNQKKKTKLFTVQLLCLRWNKIIDGWWCIMRLKFN